jgi:hypothetical protein
MQEARERHVEANKNYQSALGQAQDTNWSADGSFGLRAAERDYAQAIEKYSATVKALAEYLLEKKRAGLR